MSDPRRCLTAAAAGQRPLRVPSLVLSGAPVWWKNANVALPSYDADRLRACLLGGALGDALGFQFENRCPPPRAVLGRLGSVSDDTQLTLATAEALASMKGRVDVEAIAQAFVDAHRRDGIRGAGAATTKAIRELSVGGHWALVGRKGEMAAGNGAAIRIAPLAFVLDPNERLSRLRIRDVARITHHSDEAYVGALALCLAIHDAYHDEPADIGSLASKLPDTRVRDRLLRLAQWGGSLEEAALELGTSGYVVESVPLAIWAASNAKEKEFRSLIERVVSLGGDCDSIASMSGQVFGARFGMPSLPAEWLEQLRERSKVEEVAAGFVKRVRS